jgi:hypothetical protein
LVRGLLVLREYRSFDILQLVKQNGLDRLNAWISVSTWPVFSTLSNSCHGVAVK